MKEKAERWFDSLTDWKEIEVIKQNQVEALNWKAR